MSIENNPNLMNEQEFPSEQLADRDVKEWKRNFTSTKQKMADFEKNPSLKTYNEISDEKFKREEELKEIQSKYAEQFEKNPSLQASIFGFDKEFTKIQMWLADNLAAMEPLKEKESETRIKISALSKEYTELRNELLSSLDNLLTKDKVTSDEYQKAFKKEFSGEIVDIPGSLMKLNNEIEEINESLSEPDELEIDYDKDLESINAKQIDLQKKIILNL